MPVAAVRLVLKGYNTWSHMYCSYTVIYLQLIANVEYIGIAVHKYYLYNTSKTQ